jgi:hypothetical protein
MNGGYAHYEALQVQFQRRMSHGLQALVSYAFAKSSDVFSSDATGFFAPSVSQIVLPPLAPSEFDIRQSIAGPSPTRYRRLRGAAQATQS